MTSQVKYEKETIILWNQSDEPISIQTYDTGLKKRLDAFTQKHLELCTLERSDEFGGVFYQLEKSRLAVRLIAPYSEERRKKSEYTGKKDRV